MCKLSNTLLNNWWVKEDTTRKTRTYFEMNESGNITCPNLKDIAKAMSRGKTITVNTCIIKKER